MFKFRAFAIFCKLFDSKDSDIKFSIAFATKLPYKTNKIDPIHSAIKSTETTRKFSVVFQILVLNDLYNLKIKKLYKPK